MGVKRDTTTPASARGQPSVHCPHGSRWGHGAFAPPAPAMAASCIGRAWACGPHRPSEPSACTAFTRKADLGVVVAAGAAILVKCRVHYLAGQPGPARPRPRAPPADTSPIG